MTDDGEGSVFVEGFDEDGEDSTSEGSDNPTEQVETTPETETKDEVPQETNNTNDQEIEGEKKPELTEKGTKLDENPLSRVNQELANERAKIREYEKVLNDPTLLKSYVAQFGEVPEKAAEPAKVPEKEIRLEDVKTTEDLQSYLRQQDEKLNSKMKELDSTIQTVKSSQKDAAVSNTISNDIVAVREQYPELNPKSDSYNPDLDQAVGAMYELMDMDPKTKQFRGSARITDVANIIMKASGSSKKAGSQEAQTVIKDKRSGKAVSGSASQSIDTTNMSPGQIIASRIKQATRGR